jgi:hypothetical protein
MENNLESIQLNLKIKYLNNLVNGCSKINLNSDNIKKIITELTDQELDSFTVTERVYETERIIESEKIDYLYLKPWVKLTLIHKIIKIKEFVNSLDLSDENEIDELKDKLIELIKDKTIKIKVNYDQTKGKIISISHLSFENGKYIII